MHRTSGSLGPWQVRDTLMATKPDPGARAAPPRAYPDLHDHLEALDEAGLLITVERPINKDTEMHPLVRWQFRGGIAERDRKAFLFTNVVDSKRQQVRHPGRRRRAGGEPRDLSHRHGLRARRDRRDLDARDRAARSRRGSSTDAPCHEIVIEGDELDRPGKGLDGIPVPISTPGWDNAPYTTLSQYITKDPDTACRTWATIAAR